MATAVRVRLGDDGRDSFPVVLSGTRMTRTGRYRLGLWLAVGPIRGRNPVVLLRLGPQAEESRPVPAGAGDQSCDFGEVGEALPVMDKPVRHHRDAMSFALPFPHQD